jgi:hypothetical protein
MPGAIARNVFRVTATELRNARFAPKKIGFIARARPARPVPHRTLGGAVFARCRQATESTWIVI